MLIGIRNGVSHVKNLCQLADICLTIVHLPLSQCASVHKIVGV